MTKNDTVSIQVVGLEPLAEAELVKVNGGYWQYALFNGGHQWWRRSVTRGHYGEWQPYGYWHNGCVPLSKAFSR